MKFIPYIICLIALCTSCVSKKKFLVAENGRIAAIERSEDFRRKLEACNRLSDKQAGAIDNLTADTTEMGGQVRAYRNLLYSNKSEQEKLNALLEDKLAQLAEREKTITELREMIDAQKEQVGKLLSNVQEALMGFSSDELSVTRKDGKVYVAMSDKLLFESGSATVDKRGREALAKLAGVLNKQANVDVYIEGHTDSIPIKTARFQDNWDLSVIRATSVVRILTKDYNVSVLQIQPTGRGEYMPVADNSIPSGRSLNRRTEIIMTPKLDKLMQLLEE